MTKNAALHWATEGIRVNSIHPGFIQTPILEPTRGTEYWDAMTAMTPMGHLGQPEDIAAGVAYLASDDASSSPGSSSTSTAGTSPADPAPRNAPHSTTGRCCGERPDAALPFRARPIGRATRH